MGSVQSSCSFLAKVPAKPVLSVDFRDLNYPCRPEKKAAIIVDTSIEKPTLIENNAGKAAGTSKDEKDDIVENGNGEKWKCGSLVEMELQLRERKNDKLVGSRRGLSGSISSIPERKPNSLKIERLDHVRGSISKAEQKLNSLKAEQKLNSLKIKRLDHLLTVLASARRSSRESSSGSDDGALPEIRRASDASKQGALQRPYQDALDVAHHIANCDADDEEIQQKIMILEEWEDQSTHGTLRSQSVKSLAKKKSGSQLSRGQLAFLLGNFHESESESEYETLQPAISKSLEKKKSVKTEELTAKDKKELEKSDGRFCLRTFEWIDKSDEYYEEDPHEKIEKRSVKKEELTDEDKNELDKTDDCCRLSVVSRRRLAFLLGNFPVSESESESGTVQCESWKSLEKRKSVKTGELTAKDKNELDKSDEYCEEDQHDKLETEFVDKEELTEKDKNELDQTGDCCEEDPHEKIENFFFKKEELIGGEFYEARHDWDSYELSSPMGACDCDTHTCSSPQPDAEPSPITFNHKLSVKNSFIHCEFEDFAEVDESPCLTPSRRVESLLRTFLDHWKNATSQDKNELDKTNDCCEEDPDNGPVVKRAVVDGAKIFFNRPTLLPHEEPAEAVEKEELPHEEPAEEVEKEELTDTDKNELDKTDDCCEQGPHEKIVDSQRQEDWCLGIGPRFLLLGNLAD